jgi:hypothetical protein
MKIATIVPNVGAISVKQNIMKVSEIIREEPVASSWITDLDYFVFDNGTTAVRMKTKGGGEYYIDGVSQADFDRWMRAISKGKHWWSDIKYFY